MKLKSKCIYIHIYIYTYISKWIKDDASILCDSEFRAKAFVRQKVRSDERLDAKLRVTENRCVLFNSLTYVYLALLPQHQALYTKVDSTPTFIHIYIYIYIYINSILIHKHLPWQKKGNTTFYLTMRSYDGAETYEFVGSFLLSQLQNLNI